MCLPHSSQISFLCTLWAFLSATWSTRPYLQDVSQTACWFPSRRRHDPAWGMQSRAVSHTCGSAPNLLQGWQLWRCISIACIYIVSHWQRKESAGERLAWQGWEEGSAPLAFQIQRSRACKGQQPLLIFTKVATTKASWGKGSVPVESHLHSGYHSTMKLFQTAHSLSYGFHPNSKVPAELCLQRHIKQICSDDV